MELMNLSWRGLSLCAFQLGKAKENRLLISWLHYPFTISKSGTLVGFMLSNLSTGNAGALLSELMDLQFLKELSRGI